MKLWVDDIRPAPEGWHWAKNYNDAIDILGNPPVGGIVDASLDHDLDYIDEYRWDSYGPTGYDIVKWIWANDAWPKHSLAIHTDNPVGRQNMIAVIDKYGPYNVRDPYEVRYGANGFAHGVIYTK
jgi:hypothetical protein